MTEEERSSLTELVEGKVISSDDLNLRSKIESITRSLASLQTKKLRLDFEIKRQKKSLMRKREELKRVSKRNHTKLSVKLESGEVQCKIPSEQGIEYLRKIDNRLLRESSDLLDY